MKRMAQVVSTSIALAMISTQEVMAQYKMPEPSQNSIFGHDSKPYAILVFVYYVILAAAAIFSIGLFITSGTMASRGEWGRAAAAFVGSLVCALGAWFVATAQAT